MEDIYKKQLRDDIEFFLYHKADNFDEILRELGSVDIPIAKKIYDELIVESEKYKKFRDDLVVKRLNARSTTSYFICDLPAPNSMYSQWWFSLDSIEKIAFQIKRLVNSGKVAFFGVPTVAFYYKKCFNADIKVYDIDKDIIEKLNDNEIDSQHINLLNEALLSSDKTQFDIVFMDPPWYEKYMEQFLNQAMFLIKEKSFIIISIPSKNTRPNIIKSRQKYLKSIIDKNMYVIEINSDYFEYVIPSFENIMLDMTKTSSDRPWRKSDLLILQNNKGNDFEIDKLDDDQIISFHIKGQANQFRIFIKKDAQLNDQESCFKLVEEFSKDVSTRRNKSEEVHMWTSNQMGFSIKNYELTYEMLIKWQDGKTIDDVSVELEKIHPGITAEINDLNDLTLMWRTNTSNNRRTPKMILDSISYGPLAITDSKRRNVQQNDGFRLEFQRDRDRIIWSENFRKLANKCQVFSFEHDEISSVRTRLTHSIEVMQLATTIGSSFGLNNDLIEAGALCHDIGHTPFGHGGECALNNILNSIKDKLGGFNHYEHGLDVVEYLENPYSSAALGGFNGLNLMKETIECIAKHTFRKSGDSLSQDVILKNSKHKSSINTDFGSLESQTVRIADKISYMISDIEDGTKMGAIRFEQLVKCRLFNKSPIDLSMTSLNDSSASLYNMLISQRRAILKIVMEDVLSASEKRLIKIKNKNDIKSYDSYLIDFSSDIKDCMSEIWDKLQSGLLHNDSRVIAANFRASQIISSLFYLYAFSPELIDISFRSNHKLLKQSDYIKSYGKPDEKIGIAKNKVAQYNFNLAIGNKIDSEGDNYNISLYNIILAKDYVASLTDQRAIKEYHTHFGFTN